MEAYITSTSQYVTLLIPPTDFLYWRQVESISSLMQSKTCVSSQNLPCLGWHWKETSISDKSEKWLKSAQGFMMLLNSLHKDYSAILICNQYWTLQHAEGCIHSPVWGVHSGEVIQLLLKHLQKQETTIFSGYHSGFLFPHSHAVNTDESISAAALRQFLWLSIGFSWSYAKPSEIVLHLFYGESMRACYS